MGATRSSTRTTILRCWPRRSASWRASPTPPATPIYWHARPLDRARLHLRHHRTPRPRPAPASRAMTSARTARCSSAAAPSRRRHGGYGNLTIKKIPNAVLDKAASGDVTTTASPSRSCRTRHRPKASRRSHWRDCHETRGQRHRRPAQPAQAPARGPGDPRPRHAEIVRAGARSNGSLEAVPLEVIRSEYPQVTDFERDFPSLCFALATGVGKTRLMGAFISYLHTGARHRQLLRPRPEPDDLQQADQPTSRPNTPKYVFQGIAEFATNPPEIITGDNYESRTPGSLFDPLIECRINIFNISKINTEVRGGNAPRIKRLSRVHRRELLRLPRRSCRTSSSSWTSRTATAPRRASAPSTS